MAIGTLIIKGKFGLSNSEIVENDNGKFILTIFTFKLAYKSRQPENGLTFHSDRGAQYTASAFRRLLKTLNVTQSFSPSGRPCHNAVMESFFATLKKEELFRIKYRSLREFEQSVKEYMERYNNERPHVTLRYKTPNACEKAYFKR